LRTQIETESIIGLFVNMIVFRCDLSGDPSFRDVVQRLRITALDAYENSDLPFQELVRALKVDLRSMRSPFFQVMFGFDSEDGEQPSSLIQLDTKPGTARFDLTLQLAEGANGISGSFEYCTDLFDGPGMTALSRRFVALLGEVAANPDRSVSAFEMSTVENAEASASKPGPVSPGLFRRAIRPLSQWYSRQTRAN
jgi:non-ribosomal peptide synthetase component F